MLFSLLAPGHVHRCLDFRIHIEWRPPSPECARHTSGCHKGYSKHSYHCIDIWLSAQIPQGWIAPSNSILACTLKFQELPSTGGRPCGHLNRSGCSEFEMPPYLLHIFAERLLAAASPRDSKKVQLNSWPLLVVGHPALWHRSHQALQGW